MPEMPERMQLDRRSRDAFLSSLIAGGQVAARVLELEQQVERLERFIRDQAAEIRRLRGEPPRRQRRR